MSKEVRFLRLPSHSSETDPFHTDYCSAYEMWKSVWSKTFKDLDGQEYLHSNDWSRQSVIHCLLIENTPVAVCFHRFVDFRDPATKDDAYFHPWPEKALQGLIEHGPKIDVCSNFTISETARGDTLGFRLKDVLMGLTVKELMNSDCNSMTGTMRADKGMHKATYDVGAEVLQPNITFHNVPVDLVAFRKSDVFINYGNACDEMIETLWSSQFIQKDLRRIAA